MCLKVLVNRTADCSTVNVVLPYNDNQRYRLKNTFGGSSIHWFINNENVPINGIFDILYSFPETIRVQHLTVVGAKYLLDEGCRRITLQNQIPTVVGAVTNYQTQTFLDYGKIWTTEFTAQEDTIFRASIS